MTTKGLEMYRILDHVPEVLTELSKNTNLHLSFFSAGSRERNEAVLKSIVLTDGSNRTAFDIAFKILSYENLTPIEIAHPRARFTERFKKDLLMVTEDLNSVVLIDDIPHFVPHGQEKNVLTFKDEKKILFSFEDYSEIHLKSENAPSTLFSYFRSENRIAGAYGVIEAALHRFMMGKSRTFVDAIRDLDTMDRIYFIELALQKLYEADHEPRCSLFLKHYLKRKLIYIRSVEPFFFDFD
jgi:hypothetical protein